MTTYAGGCHCERVRFELTLDQPIARATECNCSICSKKGFLHQRVPPDRFRLVSGEEALGTYQFGTKRAKHHFCTACGIHVFTRPRAAPELYTVNVRCLDDFEEIRKGLEIVPFDGRNWESAVAQLK